MDALDIFAAGHHLGVAGHAKSRAFCGQQSRGRTGMRYVTHAAVARLERRVDLGPFQFAEHSTVAIKTHLILRLDENRFVVARMGIVATVALAFGHGPMHVNPVEFFFLFGVAGVTKGLDRRVQ